MNCARSGGPQFILSPCSWGLWSSIVKEAHSRVVMPGILRNWHQQRKTGYRLKEEKNRMPTRGQVAVDHSLYVGLPQWAIFLTIAKESPSEP